MTGKRVLAALILAILAVGGATRDAFAWGGGGCFGRTAGCYGVSAGCYGGAPACSGASSSCYGVSSGCYGRSSCYASGNGGPLRRLVAGIRSRHATAYACTGSCYGNSCYGSSCYGSSCYGSSCYGSGCYGSSGCYSSCHATCQGGATSSCYSACYSASSNGCYANASVDDYTAGSYYQTPPATQSIILPQAAPLTAAPDATTPAYVAPSAVEPTAVTPPVGDGARNDSVDLRALTSDATPPATLLRLCVPADAKVVLEDTDTRLTGSERTFRTGRLAEGEVWSNYCVRVVVEREGGEATVQEKHLDLRGGESHELRFDFGDALLASQ